MGCKEASLSGPMGSSGAEIPFTVPFTLRRGGRTSITISLLTSYWMQLSPGTGWDIR